MSGGSIIGNNASGYGGGATISEGCTFNVSGCPDIKDNWTEGIWDGDAKKYVIDSYNDSSVKDDVQLGFISTYITVTGALTSGANIYVTVSGPRVVAQKATGLSETEAGYFHSDDSDYTPVLSSDGKVVFKTQATFTDLPQVASGLIYSGEEQDLLTNFGDAPTTVKVAVTTDNSATEPAGLTYGDSAGATEAGTYYIWYYAEGTEHYVGTTPARIGPVTIEKRSVTVSGITAENKTYDGTTEATLDTLGATLSGKCDDDDLTVSATGTFNDKKAGDDKTVTIRNLTLDGEDADNYVLADSGNQEITTANITKKQITISGVTASDKEYDGTITATLNTTNATISGLVGSDAVSVTVDGTFADAGKGNNKTVTLFDWALSGNDEGNYVVDETGSQQTTTANITGTQVYITGLSAENKEYDGTTAAGITGTAVLRKVNGDAEVSGLTFSDITASFADKNIGEGKTVSITGVTLDDNDDYAINLERTNQELNLTANITAKPVTITGLSAADKTYDTTKTATVTGTAVISGKITGDSLSVSLGSAAFDEANVGSGKNVTFTGYSLTGEDASNYTLSAQPASVTANITKATPTVTAPVAKTDLVFSGSGQALVTAGSVPTGCEMKYALTDNTETTAPAENSNWSAIAPEGTNAGSYKVWYKVDGGNNYEDVAASFVTVAIEKAGHAAPALSGEFTVPTGSETVVITSVDATMEYSTDNKSWTACEATLSLGKGVYYVRKQADANHNAGAAATIVVKREGEHTFTVTGGTGTGSYVADETVTVTATAPAGEKFKDWSATGITLTEEEKVSPKLTITMPASDASLAANFEDLVVESLSLNKTATKLEIGKKESLTVSFNPATVKDSYKKVVWSSDNEGVASVDDKGNVTALKEGKATITVKSAFDESIKATCEVTVEKAASIGGGTGGGAAGGGSSDTPADNTNPSDSERTSDDQTIDVTKDPSEGKVAAGEAETSTVTGKDGSVTETIKVENTDGSTTVKEKVTTTDGTVSEKTTVIEQDGTVKTQETIEKENGSKTEKATEVKANGDFEAKTVTTNKDGEVTKTVTEVRTTNEKTGKVTLETETAKASGATQTTKAINDAKGNLAKASITETTAEGKTTAINFKTNKSGTVVVKNIDSDQSIVTIPAKVADANGKAHPVKIITSYALKGETAVTTLVVNKNVKTFEKNALSGSSVKTLKLDSVPRFEKNSLNTGRKLTIVVHSKKQARKVKDQLAFAGAPKAIVKIK